MQTSISIIIPVFNSEEFVKKSVKSIMTQSLSSMEIVLIDCRPQDKKEELLEQYAENDSRIKIICQENCGLAAARNSGLAAAKGLYVGFMDSEHWTECNMYEKLFNTAISNSSDVALCNMSNEGVLEKNEAALKESVVMDRSSILENICRKLLLQDTYSSVCDKIYLKSFLEENNISFNEGMLLKEDYLFNMDVFNFARKAVYLPENLCHYGDNPHSEMYHKDTLTTYTTLYQYKLKYSELWGVNSQEIKEQMLCDFLVSVEVSLQNLFDQRNTDKFFQKTNYVYCIVNDPLVIKSIQEYKRLNTRCNKLDDKTIRLIGGKSIFGLSLKYNKK